MKAKDSLALRGQGKRLGGGEPGLGKRLVLLSLGWDLGLLGDWGGHDCPCYLSPPVSIGWLIFAR